MIDSKELLQEYRKKTVEKKQAATLRFIGVGEQDVYNITAPLN